MSSKHVELDSKETFEGVLDFELLEDSPETVMCMSVMMAQHSN